MRVQRTAVVSWGTILVSKEHLVFALIGDEIYHTCWEAALFSLPVTF
jgi:hypothetical protein